MIGVPGQRKSAGRCSFLAQGMEPPKTLSVLARSSPASTNHSLTSITYAIRDVTQGAWQKHNCSCNERCIVVEKGFGSGPLSNGWRPFAQRLLCSRENMARGTALTWRSWMQPIFWEE